MTLYGPYFGSGEFDHVRSVLESGHLSVGAVTDDFERRCAEMLGVPDAVAVSNGTAALHLALAVLDIGPGDEVIMPSFTFVAGAAMCRLVGARPIFADIIGRHDLTVDVTSVERLIGPKSRAVVAMHYGGHPADLIALKALCHERGLALVEDSAHAFAVGTPHGSCGTVGDVGTFSFFATKNVAVGEGGLVVARDPERLARVRRLRSHAMTATADGDRGGTRAYDIDEVGFNYRPTELSSAIGLAQLDQFGQWQQRRERAVSRYREQLQGIEGLEIPFQQRPVIGAGHHLMVILIPPGTDRVTMREKLAANGIQTGMHYPPTHLLSAYRDLYDEQRSAATHEVSTLARTEDVGDRLVTLPLHPSLSVDAVDEISTHVRSAIGSCGRAA